MPLTDDRSFTEAVIHSMSDRLIASEFLTDEEKAETIVQRDEMLTILHELGRFGTYREQMKQIARQSLERML